MVLADRRTSTMSALARLRLRARPPMRRTVAAALVICGLGAARASPPPGIPPSAAWVSICTEELRAGYATLWAVSDLHGRLDALEQLLIAAGLGARDERGGVRWIPQRARQLLVVVGDSKIGRASCRERV